MSFDDENEGREVSRQLDRAQELPRDLMLLKMENESIMALARTKPRDQADIMRQLSTIIEAYPAAADEAIYCKPVGQTVECQCAECKHRYEVAPKDRDKATCPRCDSSRCDYKNAVQKYAENLSIRAAETIRSIYGMNRLATSTEDLPDGKVRVSGTFIDYATGTMTSDERIVTPWYKSRFGGGMERVPEDRFQNVTVKAEKSKLRRDLILDAVPAITKAMYRDLCEKKIAETVTEGVIEEQVLPALAKHGLSADQVESLVGRPRSLGWTNADFVMLKKLNASLKNGETTVADLLNRLDDSGKPGEPVTPPSAQGAVSGDDLANAKPSKRKTKTKADEQPEQKTGQSLPVESDAGEPPFKLDAGKTEAKTEPAVEECDPDVIEMYLTRIAKAQNAAALNAIQDEQAKFAMTIAQRAQVVGSITNRRKEVG